MTALLVQNTNPMDVAPELTKVHAGFKRDDLFVCVHEQFMTETAKMADIVLPATMFLEHDDIYQAGGHCSIQIGRKLFEPYREARSNHAVHCELAKRLGGFRSPRLSDDRVATDRRSSHPIRLAGCGNHTTGQVAMTRCRMPKRRIFKWGFRPKPDVSSFKPDWAALGPDHAVMPKLPDHMTLIDQASAARPYRLVAAPARHYLNTSFTETPTSIAKEGRPTVLIHPDDADALGVREGDLVRLGNDLGSVLLHAELAEGQQSRVLVMESIWPNHAFIEGIGINALTSADPGPPNGGAVFHDTAVWMRVEPEAAAARNQANNQAKVPA